MARRATNIVIKPGHKWCPRCQQEKPLEAFKASTSKYSCRPQDRHAYCLECKRAYEREYRKRRPDYFVAAKEKRHQKWEENKKPGVYIADLGRGIYKIGRTVNIQSRLRDLRTSNLDTELVRFVETDDPAQMERELHDILSKRRLARELYRLDKARLKDLMAWIDRRDEDAYIALKTPEFDGTGKRSGTLKPG